MKRVLVSWSSGKDSAWMLDRLLRDPSVEVVALLTTFNEQFDRVAMHAVRRELVVAQAASLGLPLWPVMLPWPCTNAVYETRMAMMLDRAREAGITHLAFGDLFLEEIRDYRVAQLAGTGVEPWFPIWCGPDGTGDLARAMIEHGLRAVLTCIDPKALDSAFVGRAFDASLLADLPDGVDPCGERGEFHTFCHAGPLFPTPVPMTVGEVVTRDGFVFADVLPPGETPKI